MAQGQVTIEINGDSEPLERSIEEGMDTVDEAVQNSKKTWTQYAEETGKTFEQIKTDIKEMAKQFVLEGDSIETAMRRAYSEIGIISEREMEFLEEDIGEVERAAEQASRSMEADFKSAFTSIGNATSKAFSGLNTFTASVGRTVGNIAVAATAATTGIIGMATAVGSGFEAQMSTVQALSGATAEQLQILTNEAKQLGIDTAFSATEAGKAFEYMALAGWDTEAMLGGIDGVLSAAAASGEDLGLVADIVTDGLTALGESADQASRFADVLAATSSNSNTNIAMMGETFKYVAPVAGTLGYSMEDLALATGLMANSGIKASQAGTSLRAAFTRIISPTSEAAGLMEKLGISATNADGSMKSLDELMLNLRSSMSGLSEAEQAQAASAIFGQEAMSGMLAIVNASEADYLKLQAAINESAGAASAMGEVKLDNLQGQLTLLGSSAEGLALQFYDSFSETATEGVRGLIEIVNDLTYALSEGGVEGFVEQLGNTLGGIAASVAEQAPAVAQGAITIIQALLDSLLSNSDAIVNAGSTVVATLLTGLQSVFPQITEIAKQVAPVIAQAIIQGYAVFLQLGVEVLTSLVQGIADNLDTLIPMAQGVLLTLVDSLLTNLPLLVESAVEILNALVLFLGDNAQLIIDGAIYIIFALVDGLLNMLDPLVEASIEIILALALGLIDAIPKLVAYVPKIIDSIVDAILNNLDLLIPAAVQILLAITEGMIVAAVEVVKAAPEILKQVVNSIAALDWGQIGHDIIAGINQGMVNAISTVKDAIGEVGGAIMGGVKDFFGIASPAKNMMPLGEFIGEGLAEGLSDSTKTVISSTNKVNEAIFKQQEVLATQLNALNKANTSQVMSERQANDIAALQSLYETLGTVELEKQEEILKQIADLQSTFDDETNALSEQALRASIEEKQAILDDYVKSYEDALNDIKSNEQKLAYSLFSDGALFTEKESGGIQLEDLEEDTRQIEAFGDALLQLQDMALPQDLLTSISEMGLSDGLAYAEELLSLNEKEYDAYIKAWEQKREASQRVAEAFYQSEITALNNEFSSKIPTELNHLKEDLNDIGQQSAIELANGIEDKGDLAVQQAEFIADSVTSEMYRAVDALEPLKDEILSYAEALDELNDTDIAGNIYDIFSGSNGTIAAMERSLTSDVSTRISVNPQDISEGVKTGTPVVTGNNEPIIIENTLTLDGEVVYQNQEQIKRDRGQDTGLGEFAR